MGRILFHVSGRAIECSVLVRLIFDLDLLLRSSLVSFDTSLQGYEVEGDVFADRKSKTINRKPYVGGSTSTGLACSQLKSSVV